MDVDKVDKMASVLLEKESKNTERSTKQSVKTFYDYLAKKNLTEPPEDKRQLCQLLKSFYQDIRKTDGSHYTKNSLQSLRYGLCRHFRTIREIDIITDVDFAEANKSYQARLIFLKDQGLDKVDHKPIILEDDLRKLYHCGVFDIRYPRTLQNKVFFETMLFFCRRYGQNPKDLRASDFEFRIDNQGRRFVCKAGYNVPTDPPEGEDGFEIMYEKGGPYCPVASLELYIKHLNPLNPSLFQKPKKDHLLINETWYENVSLGERMVSEKMKAISEEAQLSRIFYNHSIRLTTISMLNHCIFESCPLVAHLRGRMSEAPVEGPVPSVVRKKRKISETRVDVDQSVMHIPLETDKAEWAEYRTRSGQVLLIKIMEKSNSLSSKGLPKDSSAKAKNLVSIGTQTDDAGCINGCTSKYVPLLCYGSTHSLTHSLTVSRTAYSHNNSTETALEEDNRNKNMDDISDRHDTSYASDLSAVLRVLDEDESETNYGMTAPTQHIKQSQNQSIVCEKNKNATEVNKRGINYGMIVHTQVGNPPQSQESFAHENRGSFVREKSNNIYSNHEKNVLPRADNEGHCVGPNSNGEHLRIGNPTNLASSVISQYLYKLTSNITTVRPSTKPGRPRNTPIKILPKSPAHSSSTPVGTPRLLSPGNTPVDTDKVVDLCNSPTVPKSFANTSITSAETTRYVSLGNTLVDTCKFVTGNHPDSNHLSIIVPNASDTPIVVVHTPKSTTLVEASNDLNGSKKLTSPLNSSSSLNFDSLSNKETSPLNTASLSAVRNDAN